VGWAGWGIAGVAGLCAVAGVSWLATRPAPTVPAPVAAAAPIPVPAPASAAGKPGFDIVRVSPTGDAVIAGRAAPGAEVSVTDNGHEIGRAQADARGQFVVIPAAPLESGGQQLQLSARAGAAPAVAGDAPVVVVVPERPGGRANASAQAAMAPLVAAAPAAQAFAVLLPPNAPPRLLQAPGSAERPQGLGLATVDYDERGEIRFAGGALPGAGVRLYVDDAEAGTAVAGTDGRWTLQPARVAPGEHRLRLDQLAASGKVTARIELPFQRASVAPADVAGGRVQVVQPKQTLWRIAREAYGQGVQYTVIYAANREQIRNPDLIYPGQVFSIPAGSSAGADSSAIKSR
jgi:nucleoid-associated protein YgaU